MNWNDAIELVSTKLETDDVGNQIPTPQKRTILCEKKSVTRQEFYQASASGFKPALVLNVHPYEYAGEPELYFEGKKYKVLRTYDVDAERLELTCERDLGGRS